MKCTLYVYMNITYNSKLSFQNVVKKNFYFVPKPDDSHLKCLCSF